MGFFNLFSKKPKTIEIEIDTRKTEYEAWLDFTSKGGTSKQWEEVKKKYHLVFAEDETERFNRYEKESRRVSDRYYTLLQQIQKDWSTLYQSKYYTGDLAKSIEKMCIQSIALYKKMKAIDEKYGEETPTNVPAYERLAMLYQRQGDLQKAADICQDAIQTGVDMTKRLESINKKLSKGK